MRANLQRIRERIPAPFEQRQVRNAAEQGYAPAQADLGIMYLNGQRAPQDAVLAYMRLNLTAAQEPGAVEDRDAAVSQMTPDEIAKAQRMASEWKPK